MLAWESDKKDAPFLCPKCGEELVLRKGAVRQHHFSHKKGSICPYGKGESDKHHRCKREIYESIRNSGICSEVKIEYDIDDLRPDVYFVLNNSKVAIEVQRTDITINYIKEKFEKYKEKNISVIWILVSRSVENFKVDEDGKIIFRPKEWEKYLHSLYFGRIYMHFQDRYVFPIHFKRQEKWVEPGNRVDDYCDEIGEDLSETYWYQENHDQADYGGYFKKSKTIYEVIYPDKDVVDLVGDFREQFRRAGIFGKQYYGDGYLWLDTLRKWW